MAGLRLVIQQIIQTYVTDAQYVISEMTITALRNYPCLHNNSGHDKERQMLMFKVRFGPSYPIMDVNPYFYNHKKRVAVSGELA